MNTRVTLVALVLALGIGLFAIIKMTGSGTGTPSDDEGDLSDRTSQRLLDPAIYDPDAVQGIEIAWADGPTATFARDEFGMWRQVLPVPFRVTTFAMRQLSTAAGDLTIAKTISPSELTGDTTLASLNLAPAAATVTYQLKGSGEGGDENATAGTTTMTLQLGSINVGGKAYAQLADDERVYLVEDTLHRRIFQTSVNDWREQVIFENLGPEMSVISYVNHEAVGVGTAFELRQIDKKWRMIEPVEAHLDEMMIGGLMQELIGASVRGFVSDDVTDVSGWGLTEPVVELGVETARVNADGSISRDRQELWLGHPVGLADNSRYAMLEGGRSVFTVPAVFVDRVTLDAEVLISRIVLDALPADVQSLAIDGPGGIFTLARTLDGGWEAVLAGENADAEAVNGMVVQGLLARLTSAQGGVELGSVGAEDVVMTMVATGFDGTELGRFTVGAQATASGGFRVVFDDGSGVVRYADGADLPGFLVGDYVAAEGGGVGVGAGAVDPDDVSK